MKKLKIFLFFLSITILVNSQSFVDVGANLLNLEIGDVEWGDYDNDGDLDVLISGQTEIAVYWFMVYRNDSNTNFVNINAELENIRGWVSWGDYDNDMDLDILVSGGYNYNEPIIKVYRNDGSDIFVDIGFDLTQISGKSLWGDFDNDNDLDILIAGNSGFYPNTTTIIRIFENTGDAFFERDPQLPSQLGDIAIGDYDQDGDEDFAISGPNEPNGEVYATRIYRNDSNFIFTDIGANLPPLLNSQSLDWGDYDNDLDLDLIIAGQLVTPPFERICKIYKNNGNDNFIEDTINIITPLSFSNVIWGDYDNDGDLDFLYSGYKNEDDEFTTKLYENQEGDFIETDINIPVGGSVDFGDYDYDTDLDILILGRRENIIPTTRIYRNELFSTDISKRYFNKSVKIYPNPYYDLIKIESNFHIIKIEICDLIGKTVVEKIIDAANSYQVNLENLYSGVYFVKIYYKNKSICVQKIIKQ